MDLGPHGVRGDGPVAQPRHQDQALGGRPRQEGGQLPGDPPYRPAEDVLLPAGHPLQGEGHVVPRRLAQGPLPLLVQHLDGIHRDALPQAVPRLHPRQGGELPGALPPQLLGLDGQIGPPYRHIAPSLTRYLVLKPSFSPYFLPASKKYP